MAAEHYEDEYDDEQGDDLEAPLEKPGWLRDTPFWAISAVLHLVLVLILIAFTIPKELTTKDDEVQIVVRTPRKPPPYDPNLKRAMEKKPKIPDPNKVKDPIIQKKLDDVTPDIPKGTDLNNLTNVELDSTHLNTSIGVNSGASGAYGERWGKGSLVREGGSEGSEEAVRAALEWLRRHQSPEGNWSCHDFTKQCKKICTSLQPERYGDGRGFEEHDVGVTALAMLAFTGYGHTHRDGVFPEYVEVLRKAVGYMKKIQARSADPTLNGRYGSGDHEQWIYDHSIATMAMGELLVMSNDIIGLKRSVTDAVKLCLRAQNDGFGWRYGVQPGDNDTSVTGWMVLALKTAKNARLDIPNEEFERAFKGALNWFDRATASNGKTGYSVPGDEGSRLAKVYPDPYPYSKELSCMTAVGVLCRLFAGESRSSPVVKQGVDILMRSTPAWLEQKGRSLSTINIYYWYYGSYALFQFGGADWKKWNDDMQAALLPTQRQGNIDEDGSWDPIGEWGVAGGRVYATAIGAMTLEVYYRFTRAQQGVGL